MRFVGRLLAFAFLLLWIPGQAAFAETLEDQLNHLIGPKEQYNTMLSPVYLRNNTTEEQISPQSGELSLTQTDYVLPGRNGLDLEIKRIYKSGSSNVQDMQVKYVNGAWVDYVQSDATTSSFYEERYNLGIGMRFSFPSMEVIRNSDGTSHKFLHTESGDVYRLKAQVVNGVPTSTYVPEGQTIKDVEVKETNEYSNGQPDGTSQYMMVGKDGKKTYFTEDGRIVGIVDRYGNTIKFEYTSMTYTIDGTTSNRNLLSRITDTIGRVTTIEYKEDETFTAGPATESIYGPDDTFNATQNPNPIDSGDLQGKFQVIVHLPGDKQLVYDKSAVLVSASKHVIRTRLQRVFDVDGKAKYHYWYEQPDLGFTYMNGAQYSTYNRYENLVQIDYSKTNRIKRYVYETFTKQLNKGSMQYRKIFEKKELVKLGFDPAQGSFMEKLMTAEKDKLHHKYTNEADGYGSAEYKEFDNSYLHDTYRYYSEVTDLRGNTTKYTYDGVHQLLLTEKQGADHREVITTDRDEMKLVKKQESLLYQIVDGQVVGDPMRTIENYRYDEYGNLTNYTGPEASRDETGYPTDNEHTVVYTYAYDKFHVLNLKTWKKDPLTTSQVQHDIDGNGNVVKETKVNSDAAANWVVTDFQYDGYGNLIRKEAHSGGQSFVTQYDYGVDAGGTDLKGAYLAKEFQLLGGQEIAKKFTYDLNTGRRSAEIDANGNRTVHEYDVLGRVVKTTMPDLSWKEYSYLERPYSNLQIQYTDPEGTPIRQEYDILGNLVQSSVFDQGQWNVLKSIEYDAKGNITKEIDANGHSVRFEYDSLYRLIRKSSYELDAVSKGDMQIDYSIGQVAEYPLIMTTTDEEGYVKKFYYDIRKRLQKVEATPDRVQFITTSYTYDYVGNKLTETDANQETTTYTYDAHNRLVRKKDALGYETSFVYNALDQVVHKKEPGGRVTDTQVDALGRISQVKIYGEGASSYTYTSYEYDAAGNISRMRQGLSDAGVDRVATATSYVYDALNRLVDEFRQVDETRTAHTHHTYNRNGNKTQTIQYADAAETEVRVFDYGYDYRGKVKEERGAYRETDGTGGTVQYGSYQKLYDRDYAGNVVREMMWNGYGFDTTTYAYNYKNQVAAKEEPYANGRTKTTRYEYDKVGNKITETLTIQGDPTTVTYGYDGLGRLIHTIDPLGNATRYAYDANGNRIKQVDARYMSQSVDAAPGLETEYDALNRPVKAIAFDGHSKVVIGYKEYDARGNVTKEVDGEGYNAAQPEQSVGILTTYDANNRKITVTTAQTAADNAGNGTQLANQTFTYDGVGNVLSVTDAAQRTTRYTYYGTGLPREKMYPDGLKESYDYDLTGKAMVLSTDRAGSVTKSYLTVFDKPYRIEYPDGSSESFAYSPKGELTEKTDQHGHTAYIKYNAAGNPIEKAEWIRSDGGTAEYKLSKSEYDEANRPIGSETFQLRTAGHPLFGGSAVSAGDRVEMTYDKAGRVVRVAGPHGRETRMEYDRAGFKTTERKKVADDDYDVTRFGYDTLGRLTAKSLLVKTSDLSIDHLANAQYDNTYFDRVLSTTTYRYYKNGTVMDQTDPNGYMATYEYDYDGKVTKKIDPMHASTRYRYDTNGNLVGETNANGAVTVYEYDAINRLIRKKTPAADGSLAVTRYVLDAVGNIVKEIAPNQYVESLDLFGTKGQMAGASYTYDSMKRRTSTVSPDGEGIEYIRYNLKGLADKVVDGLRYTGDMAVSTGTVFEYDGLGRVVRKTDALGHQAGFEYDVLGNLTSQTDERGYTSQFTYNPDRTLSDASYADGGRVSFTYDKLGHKLTETNQLGATTSYSYNAFGQLKAAVDPYGFSVESKYDLAGNLVSAKDKRGSVKLLKYDGNRRLTEKRVPLELDESGNTVYRIETYGYDLVGNPTLQRMTHSKDKSFLRETQMTYYANNLVQTVSDNSDARKQSYYDRNGNVVKVEMLREASSYDIEKYEYDNRNQLVKQIRLVEPSSLYNTTSMANAAELQDSEYPDRVQLVTGYEYDVLGNRGTAIDPRAYAYAAADSANRDVYTIRYTYDSLNRLEKTIQKVNGVDVYREEAYDEVGNKISDRDERGYVTKYAYDGMNRLTSMTDAENQTFTYAYDLAGNKVSETNANGNSMTYGYDGLKRRVTVTDPYGAVVARYVYDENGNVTKKIEAKGYLAADTDDARYGTLYKYDLANRLVREVDPELSARNDPERFTRAYRYNPVGEKISETDALGHTTTFKIDEAGRLVQVTNPLDVSVTYSYDKAGNKLFMVDGRGKTTEFRYGSFGLLVETLDATGRSTHYRYDLSLNTAEMTDRIGNHTRYTHDSRNVLSGKSVAETGDSMTYRYDEAGNRVSMTDADGTHSYGYDGNQRLVSVAMDGQLQLTYTYDAIGNIATVTDKTGFTTSYTYDKSSRMETASAAGKTTSYSYDENGNRSAVVYTGGVTEQYVYDKANRLLELTNRKPDGSLISSYYYTYDDAGNQTSKTDSFGKTTYAYDAAGRILKVEAPGKTTIYTYDGAGNRQTQHETYTSAQPSGYTDPVSQVEVQYNIKKSEYLYSKAGELLQLAERMLDADSKQVLEKTTTYLYDDNGNEIRQKVAYIRPHNRDMRPVTGGSPHGETVADDPNAVIEKVSNTFDGFNQLIQTERVKVGERVTVEYTYDGDGLRTQKTVRSSKDNYAIQVTRYLYDRQYVILETDASDHVSVHYVRGINYVARIDASDKLSYFLYNGHGDVVHTVSEAGEVENQYDYDIFGNSTLTIEQYSSSIRYAGEFFDAEVGLYYLRARYYNPYTGRFISEDSYWGEDANPLSLNRYTYAHNNPLMFVDPSGHSSWLVGLFRSLLEGVLNPKASNSDDIDDYLSDDQEEGVDNGTDYHNQDNTSDPSPESSYEEPSNPFDGNFFDTSLGGPMDDITKEDIAYSIEIANSNRMKIAADRQKEMDEIDRELAALEEQIRINNKKIAEIEAELNEVRDQLAQLRVLGERINQVMNQSDKLVEEFNELKDQAQTSLDEAEVFQEKYKYIDNIDLTKLESKRKNVLKEVVVGFILEIGDSLGDSLDFATYAIDDPYGAGKDVAHGIVDTSKNILDKIIDPKATYEDAKNAVADFYNLPKEDQARAFGALLANFSPTRRTELLIPDGKGGSGGIDSSGSEVILGNKGTGKVSPKITELHTKLDDLAEKHLLPQFREIDPNLKSGYTGSFKTGAVGNPNKTTYGQPIDLNKYDIDYYIESDILYEKFGNSLKANPEFRKILSETPGFEGLKPNKEGFSIKFKPSSN